MIVQKVFLALNLLAFAGVHVSRILDTFFIFVLFLYCVYNLILLVSGV